MQNSDSGNKLNPGDRVRVRHRPELDGAYSKAGRASRVALNGQICEVIEVDAPTAHVRGADVDAWFELSEIELAAPLDVLDADVQQALAAARREAQGWHSAALLARGEADAARERLAEVEAERDALRGACEAVVGPAVGVSAGALSASVRAAWSILKAEQAARYDALACERAAHEETGRIADRRRKERDAAVSRALAAEAALAAERSIHETAALGADKLARQIAAVRAAWGRMRAFLLALPRPLGAAGIEGVDAVDKALGGVAVPRCAYCANPPANGLSVCLDHGKQGTIDDPVEPRIAWRGSVSDFVTDLEQRVAEVEARLGRLESGEALAKMLEGYGDARRP